MSGVPLSFIEVNVGIVAPGTNSTSHPYPSSRMILSTFAINSADAQFCSAEQNWASAELMANVDKIILEEGYGCEVELVPGATMPTFTSMNDKGTPDMNPGSCQVFLCHS